MEMVADTSETSAPGATNRRAVGIVFLVVVIDLLGFGIVLPLLPLYGEELVPGTWALGLLMASYSAMQFLFVPVWGRVSDRVGRRPILMLGLAGSAGFYGLFGYGSTLGSLPLLFAARMGAGIACATIATAQAYIADCTPPQRRTHGMALIGAAFGIGFVIGPLLGVVAQVIPVSPSVHVLSPMPGYVAAGLSAAALAVAAAWLPESLQPTSRAAGRDWFHLGDLRAAIAQPSIGSLILIYFVTTLSLGMFETTLALVTEHALGFHRRDDVRKILFVFVYAGFCMAVAQGMIVRPLSKRLGDSTLAWLGLLCEGSGIAGVIAVCSTGSFRMFAVVLPAVLVGFALLNSSVQAMISRRTRPDQQGGILGINQSGSALARIIGPLVAIPLFGDSVQTMSRPYWCTAGLLALILFVLWRLPKVADRTA